MNYATFLSVLLIYGAPLLSFYFTVPALAANSTTNSSHILLSCGTSETSLDTDENLSWVGDIGSKYISNEASQNAKIPYQDPAVPKEPFSTARIFTSNYTYTFTLSPGRYFLRLYFYPTNYSNYPAANSFFTATAGPYTLLNNFSALMTVNALNYAYLIREFSINVTSSTLNLTFSPSTKQPNAYAFVNGIEIMPSPDIFSSSTTYYADGANTPFPYDQGTAFQTMYRLNVGGRPLAPSEDSGLYRSWEDDSNYIFGAAFGVTFQNDTNVTIKYPPEIPQYIAPVQVYKTARSMGPNPQINLNYNLTWILNVDAGFNYLLRFHFCEIQYPMTKPNQRVFFIYINNQTAQTQFDVIAYSGGIGIPIYRDYVVITGGLGQMDMWVALHPDLSTKTEYFDSILNGLEVFKMSVSENNLAGLNPVPQIVDPSRTFNNNHKESKGKVTAIIAGVVGSVLLLSFIVCICLFMIYKQKTKKDKVSEEGKVSEEVTVCTPLSFYGVSNSQSDVSRKTNTTSTGTSTGNGTGTGSHNSPLPAKLCRYFSFHEILAATNGFDEALVLGVGGFGKVYRGEIDNGSTKVAIKRGDLLSDQGIHEFQTEIELLSKLRHRHLVSLIGYCEEENEMILVYDYMAHGTLREHLYKTQSAPAPLTWRQRLEICIGAARGLHYLHTGAKHTVIHRDVKTTNILLDEKWVAKVSDFGLSKIGPTLDNTHVSTAVKGSFGYLDPEYFRRQQLSEKSDVYSFGVVLFEVLCARPPIISGDVPKQQVNLADWALFCQRKGALEEIIDSFLRGKIAPQCLKKYAEIAEKCLADEGVDRPSIGDVLWNLEFALQLQINAEESGSVVGGTTSGEETPAVIRRKKELADEPTSESTSTTNTTMSMGGRSIVSTDSDRLMPSSVFSEIINPKGR